MNLISLSWSESISLIWLVSKLMFQYFSPHCCSLLPAWIPFANGHHLTFKEDWSKKRQNTSAFLASLVGQLFLCSFTVCMFTMIYLVRPSKITYYKASFKHIHWNSWWGMFNLGVHHHSGFPLNVYFYLESRFLNISRDVSFFLCSNTLANFSCGMHRWVCRMMTT